MVSSLNQFSSIYCELSESVTAHDTTAVGHRESQMNQGALSLVAGLHCYTGSAALLVDCATPFDVICQGPFFTNVVHTPFVNTSLVWTNLVVHCVAVTVVELIYDIFHSFDHVTCARISYSQPGKIHWVGKQHLQRNPIIGYLSGRRGLRCPFGRFACEQ